MTRDLNLRIIFIPLLGVCLPLAAGIISYPLYAKAGLIGANLYFIVVSFLIWRGCTFIHNSLRPHYQLKTNPFIKITLVCFVSMIYGALAGGLSALLWMKISKEPLAWNSVYRFVLCCMLAVVVFTLIYEILFLNRERERDTQIVDQLDRERMQAELHALRNEMDPHFIFNSLNTLNHLILNNPEQAHLFNNRLAQSYKYFLVNKKREVIPLEEELDFINNYFFLLQTSHDNKLQLQVELTEAQKEVMIPPCALQLLLENAIKHNQFTQADPLQVKISSKDQYLLISNNVKSKLYPVNSTGIGLKNLSSRYRIICRKDIIIEKNRESFTVKLPLIK